MPSLFQPLKNNKYRISKSRYDSIDSYLSKCGEKYNDIDLTIDKGIYEQLVQNGEQPCGVPGSGSAPFLESTFHLFLTPGLVSVFSVKSLTFLVRLLVPKVQAQILVRSS